MAVKTVEDNFDVIEKCLDKIYNVADCDGADRISHYLNVVSDHLELVKQQRENAAASTVQATNRLLREIESLRTALAGLARVTNMRLVQHARGLWYCPICRAESKSLAELEQGIGHKENCEFAEAWHVLNSP